jgi:hypothetical protein
LYAGSQDAQCANVHAISRYAVFFLFGCFFFVVVVVVFFFPRRRFYAVVGSINPILLAIAGARP